MKDIMIDLETLGTSVQSAFVTIGAVKFDIETGERGETFYEKIDLSDAIKHRNIDGDTLKWWLQQESSAQLELINGKRTIKETLELLASFVDNKKYNVWGNGATFDISMLEHAYNQFDIPIPWNYRNIMDVRTIVRLTKGIIDPWQDYEFSGTEHNALDDAVFQASYVSEMYQYIRNFKNIDVSDISSGKDIKTLSDLEK